MESGAGVHMRRATWLRVPCMLAAVAATLAVFSGGRAYPVAQQTRARRAQTVAAGYLNLTGSMPASNSSLEPAQQYACAGSPVNVSFAAGSTTQPGGTVTMYLLDVNAHGGYASQPVPEAESSGVLQFATLPEWAALHFYFVWTQPARTDRQLTIVASSSAVQLRPPADVCGVCGGDNSSCVGCDGVPNSGKRHDECGVCGGSNHCLDCRGIVNGTHRVDACGNCLPPVFTCSGGMRAGHACEHDGDCFDSLCGTKWPGEHVQPGAEWNACVDCAGKVNGTARQDSCGVCGGDDDSCVQGYRVQLAASHPSHAQLCVGDELRVTWQAPEQQDVYQFSVSYREVRDTGGSGGTLTPAGWAFTDPALAWIAPLDAAPAQGPAGDDALTEHAWQSTIKGNGSDARDFVLGRVWLAAGGAGETGARGEVMMNRSSDVVLPEACGSARGSSDARQHTCLWPGEYMRPAAAGTYRLRLHEGVNPAHLAQSPPFEVLPPRDVCGVCGGNGSTCLGCDGVPLAEGGAVEDSCGKCGGADYSCSLAPRLGLLPYPVDALCQLTGSRHVSGSFWWTAPSNKSSADFVAVCPASAPPMYDPTRGCIALGAEMVGRPAGRAHLNLALDRGKWELRYFERSRRDQGSEDGKADFTLEYAFTFDVLESAHERCAYREHAVRMERDVYCVAQPLRIEWTVPPDTSDVERERAVVSVFAYDMYADLQGLGSGGGGPAAELTCVAACLHEEGCGSCYERVCKPAGIAPCPDTNSGNLTLTYFSGFGHGGLMADAAAEYAEYRACYFATFAQFPHAPLVCSDAFRIHSSPVDACGVCQGNGPAPRAGGASSAAQRPLLLFRPLPSSLPCRDVCVCVCVVVVVVVVVVYWILETYELTNHYAFASSAAQWPSSLCVHLSHSLSLSLSLSLCVCVGIYIYTTIYVYIHTHKHTHTHHNFSTHAHTMTFSVFLVCSCVFLVCSMRPLPGRRQFLVRWLRRQAKQWPCGRRVRRVRRRRRFLPWL